MNNYYIIQQLIGLIVVGAGTYCSIPAGLGELTIGFCLGVAIIAGAPQLAFWTLAGVALFIVLGGKIEIGWEE